MCCVTCIPKGRNLPGAVLNMCCVTSFSGIYKSQACTAECVLSHMCRSGIVTRAVVLIWSTECCTSVNSCCDCQHQEQRLLREIFPSSFCMFLGYSSGKSIEEFTACTLFLVTCLFLLPACQLLV